MRLLMLMLSAGMIFAQDKAGEATAPAVPREAAIIPVKTLTGDSFDRLMNMLQVFGVPFRGDSQLRTIIVYAPKETVDQIRHVVEQLDRPGSEAAIGRNIDMTLTLLHCGASQQAMTALSPDIEPVVKQLRAVTTCKDAQAWETIPIRLQEGKNASEELRLPGAIANGQHASVSLRMHPEAVYRKEQDRYIRFSDVSIHLKIPLTTGGGFSWNDVGINTSGDFREGQKTVLGKMSGGGEDDSVFAVISLKVLD